MKRKMSVVFLQQALLLSAINYECTAAVGRSDAVAFNGYGFTADIEINSFLPAHNYFGENEGQETAYGNYKTDKGVFSHEKPYSAEKLSKRPEIRKSHR